MIDQHVAVLIRLEEVLVSDVPIALPGYSDHVRVHVRNRTHRPNVETRFHCSQVFLSLDFQCRDDVSESN